MKEKIHYRLGGCIKTKEFRMMWHRVAVTERIVEVTCSQCLKIIEKKGLHDRMEFPEVPTFKAKPSGPCTVSFICPVCGNANCHGNSGPGHRVSHCDCWSRGYHVEF